LNPLHDQKVKELSVADVIDSLRRKHWTHWAGWANDLVAQCVVRLRANEWRSPCDAPAENNGNLKFSVAVVAVIYDPNFYDRKPFVDIVSFWPASGEWTVTHSCRADQAAGDHPVHVVAWKPLDAVPAPWSHL
jgi:hypothetical protein